MATTKINASQQFSSSADWSANSHKITNVATPTEDSDVATKSYVDGVAQGLDIKQSVKAATTVAGGNITLSGTYTIDTVPLSVKDRVLVKNQTATENNGIWVVSATAWTRATDANSSANITAGMFVFVEDGAINGDTGWTLTTNNPIDVGVTQLTFTQFSGAGSYTAGEGMTSMGTTFNVIGTANRITVNTDSIDISANYAGQNTITTVGTINSGTWTGTAVANNYIATTLSGKTYNGLSLTAATTGFTIAGGTTSKTLTVGGDASVSGSNTGDQTNITGSAASFTGNLAGDVTGTQSATVVGKINGVSLATLGTGILKNTTTTGVPSIAIAADFPTLNQNTTGTASNVTGIVAIVNGGTGSNTQNFVDLSTTQTVAGAKTFSGNISVGGTLGITGTVTMSGAATIGTTLGVTGVATFTAAPIVSSTTASQALFTSATKQIVSNALTGTGNVVMSNSPTLVTPTLGVATATSINALTLSALATGFSIAGGTASKTLIVSNSMTLTAANDTSTLNISTGGTLGTAAFTATTAYIPSTLMTAVGDIIYGATAGAATKLVGNTSTTTYYLKSTGTGTVATAPAWTQIAYSEISGTPTSLTPAAHVLDSGSHTITGKTAGQVLLATAATTFGFTSISGDATLAGSGALTLASTITAAGPIGSTSVVPVITYDAKGRLTAVTTATITPATIGAVAKAGDTMTGTLVLVTGTTVVAPIKFVAGTNTSTALAGAMEWDGVNLFITQSSGPTRKTISYTDTAPAAHVLDSASHTISGKTAGQLLVATTAATFGFVSMGTDATLAASGALTISNSAVTLAKMANLAATSIIGNNTGSAATPLALTGAQVTAMLSTFATNATTKGVVPGSNNVGATYFLDGSGSWSVPNINATRFIMGELAGGTANGINTAFTCANTPVTGKEMVFVNGLLQRSGTGMDYTISGANITFLAGSYPQTGDVVILAYIY